MSFDQIQKLVIEHYNAGEHIVREPKDIAGCGDGLLQFLLVELSKAEDCHSINEAIDRVESAIRQLTALSNKLQEL